jgi:hypothetical protein
MMESMKVAFASFHGFLSNGLKIPWSLMGWVRRMATLLMVQGGMVVGFLTITRLGFLRLLRCRLFFL